MAFKLIVLLFFILCSPGFSQESNQEIQPQLSHSTLKEFWDQMNDIFDDPNFSSANLGVVIQSLETGEFFYKRNENKLFMPASNLKLFTTAAALFLLGPDYRFSTNIYKNGNVDGSILVGDLVIQGRGDPTISGRFYDNDIYTVYNLWADSLLAAGIDEITGNIIGDDNQFDDLSLGTGWAWDHESYWYSAPSSAISFNDNCVDISITIDEIKHPVVKINPDTKYVIVVNNVKYALKDSATAVDVYRERGTNLATVFGTIRDGDSVKTYVTVNNPTQYSMVILKSVLEKKGIKIGGFAIDIDDVPAGLDYAKLNKIFTHYSVPLNEIIKITNKNSHNFYAEQILKTIGLETFGLGTAENGIEASREIYQEMGIDPENMTIVDGSGVSRLNLVTPRQVVSLLNFMYKSNLFPNFYNSLPIAGIDATLGTRMKNTKAQSNVRAKAGFIEMVRSLSGYVHTGDNEPVAFTIIANNFNVPAKLVDNLQDLVCLRLANFKRK